MAVNVAPTPLTQRTDSLVSRVDRATDSLLSRFSAIAELSFSDSESLNAGQSDPIIASRSAATAASASLQIEEYTHQMVRAAEELRSLIREVKEAWILSGHTEKAGQDDQQEEEESEQDGEKMDIVEQEAKKGEVPSSEVEARLKQTLIQLGSQSHTWTLAPAPSTTSAANGAGHE